MGKAVRTVLVGVGGYGEQYVLPALQEAERLGIELVGAVDPSPERCSMRAQLESTVGSIHRDLDSF